VRRACQQACCRRNDDRSAGPDGTTCLDRRDRPLCESRPEARPPGKCPGAAHVLLHSGPRAPGRRGHPRVATWPEWQMRDIVQGSSAPAPSDACAADGTRADGTCVADDVAAAT
jgi:hypothetical protein